MTTLKKDPSPGGPTTDGSTIYTDQHNAIVDRLGGETALTANRVINTDASGNIEVSSVTKTTLGYLDASSSIQTQIDSKQASDTDLTAIAGLSPTNDDIIQRKAGAWTNRTMAQLRTDLNVEDGADMTDATNVNAAGATMNTDTDVSSNSWVLDEDTMTSNSATKVATQQSVKAYADSLVTGEDWTEIVSCVLEVPEGNNTYPDIHTLATASAKVSGFVMPNALDSTINFKCVVPPDLAASPSAKFRVRVMTMDARTNEDIVLLSQHVAIADTENLDQALVNTTSGGDSGALRMPNATESLDYYEATFQTQPVAGDTIIGQITREASSDANDDYLADILIIGIDLLINRTAI